MTDVEEPDRVEGSERRRRRRFADRDLPLAIVSGLLLLGLFLGSIFWHPLAFTTLVGLLVIVGVVETSRVLHANDRSVAVPVVVVSAAVLIGGTYVAGVRGQAVGIALLFVGGVVWELADPRRQDAFDRVSHTLMLGLWVPFLATYAVLLVTRPTDGWLAILATAGAAIVSDVGAYGVGMAVGHHKLAPSISPGKTWEGVVGGVLVAAVAGGLVLPLLGDLFTWPFAALFAAVVGTSGVVGDLVESMLKRDLGVKDFGAIIPGHGGVLDRVDGILVGLPVGYYVLVVAGR